jgi:hypothetical protein
MAATTSSRGARTILGSLAFLLVLAGGGVADARKVAVLRFGGVHGSGARAKLTRALRGKHTVLGATAVPDACSDLGIRMSKGRNLARCAQKVGAVAVIGGTTGARKLTLVIFSGKTGAVIGSGRARWSSFPSRGMVRGAMRIINRALAKAPRYVGRRPAPRRPAPRRPAPRKPDPPDEPGGLTFEPDDIGSGGKGSGKPSGGSPDGLPSMPDEDPLAPKGPAKPAQPETRQPDAGAKKSGGPEETGDPRAYGTVGLGTWFRSFSINQPADARWDKGYSSGAAFIMHLELAARPLAFFMDGFAAGIYARMRFQTTLGLKSGFAGGSNTGEKLSTSISQFLLDFGYHWNIFGKADSPRVEFGLGYGMLDFSIDWGSIAAGDQIPSAAYRFVLIGAGGSYPFVSFASGKMPLSAVLRFDYRIVLDAGGVVGEAQPGFGPSSTGGLALALGLKSRYGAIVFGLEYTYTRFFYSFSDVQNRVNQTAADPSNPRPAAGGALDEMHAIVVSGGYSF